MKKKTQAGMGGVEPVSGESRFAFCLFGTLFLLLLVFVEKAAKSGSHQISSSFFLYGHVSIELANKKGLCFLLFRAVFEPPAESILCTQLCTAAFQGHCN